MKKTLTILIALTLLSCSTDLQEATQEQSNRPESQTTENLIVITLDGLRWQEIFGEEDVLDRNYLSSIGNLYGDRDLGNLVNVANGSRVSYAGYHEIFTGNITGVIGNNPIPNPHKTVFQYISEQQGYEGRNTQIVSASSLPLLLFRPDLNPFRMITTGGVWENYTPIIESFGDLFNTETIYNAEILDIINSAISKVPNYAPLINTFSDGNQNEELLIYLIGKEVIERDKPKAFYLYFSATDKYAHINKWNDYLNAAKNVSIYIKDLISLLDDDPQYANNTTILITTDHGRGTTNWTNHGRNVAGSDQTWFALISPTTNRGIVTDQKQYYNKQFAQTMANILGFTYEADHEIAEPLDL